MYAIMKEADCHSLEYFCIYETKMGLYPFYEMSPDQNLLWELSEVHSN